MLSFSMTGYGGCQQDYFTRMTTASLAFIMKAIIRVPMNMPGARHGHPQSHHKQYSDLLEYHWSDG